MLLGGTAVSEWQVRIGVTVNFMTARKTAATG
jgi:hypothetical protein